MERIAEASARFKARIAGVLSLLSLLTAAFTELFVRGRFNIVGGLIAVAGMVAVTLLLYDIFKPVNRASLCSRRPSTSRDSPLGLFDGILGAWTSPWYLTDSIAS
jgi:hypothetical protein